MKAKEAIPIILIAALFLAAIFLYPHMPERMPIHWNSKGEIDTYSSKFVGLFTPLVIILAIYLSILIIPRLAANTPNVESFRGYLPSFNLAILIFLIIVYIAALLPNFNYVINMNYIMVPALAALFYYVGHTLKFMKRNFFVGIRTPWTLASDGVWQKTHRLGIKTFKLNALAILVSLAFINYFIWILIGSIIINIVVLTTYSYLQLKKENSIKNRHQKKK